MANAPCLTSRSSGLSVTQDFLERVATSFERVRGCRDQGTGVFDTLKEIPRHVLVELKAGCQKIFQGCGFRDPSSSIHTRPILLPGLKLKVDLAQYQ